MQVIKTICESNKIKRRLLHFEALFCVQHRNFMFRFSYQSLWRSILRKTVPSISTVEKTAIAAQLAVAAPSICNSSLKSQARNNSSKVAVVVKKKKKKKIRKRDCEEKHNKKYQLRALIYAPQGVKSLWPWCDSPIVFLTGSNFKAGHLKAPPKK